MNCPSPVIPTPLYIIRMSEGLKAFFSSSTIQYFLDTYPPVVWSVDLGPWWRRSQSTILMDTCLTSPARTISPDLGRLPMVWPQEFTQGSAKGENKFHILVLSVSFCSIVSSHYVITPLHKKKLLIQSPVESHERYKERNKKKPAGLATRLALRSRVASPVVRL